ncbi:MAG TPA: tetratricopeptide repeat protein [Symbiobacteriaceae bacterium]|nr:tetratricopeptide repeat protein [Symbiobacteriaceae bacterium]
MQAKDWPAAIRAAERAVQLDPRFAPAQFNLGASLYRSERYQEAIPHLQIAYDLNKKQVEPGWYLALAYEKAGDLPHATAIFQELALRFPDDQDVKQALARLQVTAPVTWTIPGDVGSWTFLGDKLLLKRRTSLDAIGPGGTVLWSVKADEIVAFNDNHTLAIVNTENRGQVINLQTGAPLGTIPALPNGKGTGTYWHGDIILQESDVRASANAGAPPSYMHTEYAIYRLTRNGARVEFQTLNPQIEAGRSGSASVTGALIPANFGTGVAFYRDGKPTATALSRATSDTTLAITAAGDYIYRVTGKGELLAYDLTGRQLWQVNTGGNRVHEWYRGKETWLALTRLSGTGSYEVFDARGRLVKAGEGYVGGSSSKYLLVSLANECQLLSEAGQVVARYPARSDITPDGRWVYTEASGKLTAYPVVNP